MAWLTTRCLAGLATPHRSDGSRRNRTADLALMRGTLSQLSYRAAKHSAANQPKLARNDSQSPFCITVTRSRSDDRKYFRHNFLLQSPRRELNSPPLAYQSSAPPSELRGQRSHFRFPIADWRLIIATAPRSIADCGFQIADSTLPQSAIHNPQSATLLPGLRNQCFAIKASSAKRWRQDSNPRSLL